MKLRNIIIGGAILSVVAGILIGRTVTADSPEAGSSADPVVSQSYADKAIQDRIKGLETEVAELAVQAQALQNTINELQAKVNKTPVKTTTPATGTTKPSTGTTTPSTGTDTPGTGTTTNPPATGGSLVGKTVSASSNSGVNVRSDSSTSASIIAKAPKDEIMTIQQVKDSWYQVKMENGTIGWVASWVVEVK